MNERIKELINEATSFKEGDTEGKYDIEVFDKEKFALLIIEECADVINAHKYTDPDNFAKWILNQGIARGAHSIKEHFGD